MTDNIAFDADAAAVQAAVDSALSEVPGYVAGDAKVAAGPLTSADMTIEYGGSLSASVNDVVIITDVDLAGDGEFNVGVPFVYQAPSPDRIGYGALLALGIADIDFPEAGKDLTAEDVTVTPSGDGARFPYSLSADTVKAIVLETSIEEGNDTVATVLNAALRL